MTCAHTFTRRPFWWLHTKRWYHWRCIHCGMTTRTYDMADFAAMRPIHPHMTVVVPGYNTTRKDI